MTQRPAAPIAAPYDPDEFDPAASVPVFKVKVTQHTIQDALARINATLHASTRKPTDAERYTAAQLLAALWATVESCGHDRDDVTVCGGRFATLALDVAQLATRRDDRAAEIDAIRERREAETYRIRKPERRTYGPDGGKGSTTGNSTRTNP